MSTINETAILNLEKNSLTTYEAGVEILLRLLENVIKDPANPKYRTIRLENKIIKEKLLNANGMLDVLLNIGFERKDSELHLSPNVTLAKIKKYREFLLDRMKQFKNGQKVVKPIIEKVQPRFKRPALAFKSYYEKIHFPKILNTQNVFLTSLEEYSDGVMQYKDDSLIKYAKSIIPSQRLQLQAIQRLRSMQKSIKAGEYKESEPCLKDLFLVELLNWFNEEFFEWVDTLPCKICKQENNLKTSYVENNVRVEMIKCCGTETKFYRYNDVSCLLRTRRGRCGEYANCFTFLCRCMGYDARHVLATFDHVWTEVYSVAQKRWIHLDPSDNVIDSPLMYQHGWNRRVDYVISFAEDEIQDVTWRYTNDHKKTLSLRQKCSEEDLLTTIEKINKKRQKDVPKCRRKYLARRCLNEIIEFTVEKTVTENEKKGRSSGGLAWRQLRGEQQTNNMYSFEANEMETTRKQFNLRYSCSQNVYHRYMKNDGYAKISESYNEWETCVFTSKNMFRKVEKDWKMVYLARQEGTTIGELTWKFDFSNSGLKIKTFSLDFEKKTFENGKITLKILSKEGLNEVIGSSCFTITAKVEGDGDSWQHAQIFRQSLNSVDYPFNLSITFY